MQSMEAMLSFVFFISIASAMLAGAWPQRDVDDSLYRAHLAEDAWRILYLRGDFQDLGVQKRDAVESDLEAIGRETDLCIFMGGLRMTNCRGGEPHDATAALTKTVFYDGMPRSVAFSLGK